LSTPDYLKPYEAAVKEFGGTFSATLWHSEKGQQLRFNTLVSLVNFANMKILDIGCETGDFSAFLISNKIHFELFHGIDAMSAMIQTAKNRQLKRSKFTTLDVFENIDLLQGYDWITMSGTLNAMSQKKALQLIDWAFEASSNGVAFNFLSDQCNRAKSNEDLTPASRFDTLSILKYALQKTSIVSFDQSYLNGHDATIVMRKTYQSTIE